MIGVRRTPMRIYITDESRWLDQHHPGASRYPSSGCTSGDMGETGEPSPLPARRRGCAIKKKPRSHRLRADGVVDQEVPFNRTLVHHPAAHSLVAARYLLMCSAPLLARRGDGSPSHPCLLKF